MRQLQTSASGRKADLSAATPLGQVPYLIWQEEDRQERLRVLAACPAWPSTRLRLTRDEMRKVGAGVGSDARPPLTADVRLRVNGQQRALALDVRTSLLDALREHLGLTGSKKGCDHG